MAIGLERLEAAGGALLVDDAERGICEHYGGALGRGAVGRSAAGRRRSRACSSGDRYEEEERESASVEPGTHLPPLSGRSVPSFSPSTYVLGRALPTRWAGSFQLP